MKTSDKSKVLAFAIESAIDALFKATQRIDEPDDDCAHWVSAAIVRLRNGLSEAGLDSCERGQVRFSGFGASESERDPSNQPTTKKEQQAI